MGKWKMMLLLLAMAACISGWMKWQQGMKYPVYHQGPYVSDLIIEEKDSRGWYEALAKHETPHKRLTDSGRGLISLGIGLFCGVGFLELVKKVTSFSFRVIGIYWLFCWGGMIPLDLYYYRLTFERMDYLPWSDSLGVPLITTHINGILGYLITLLILRRLLKNRELSHDMKWPNWRAGEGRRTIFIICWSLLLFSITAISALHGIMGTAFSCIGAVPVLLLVLSSRKNGDVSALTLFDSAPQALESTQ